MGIKIRQSVALGCAFIVMVVWYTVSQRMLSALYPSLDAANTKRHEILIATSVDIAQRNKEALASIRAKLRERQDNAKVAKHNDKTLALLQERLEPDVTVDIIRSFPQNPAITRDRTYECHVTLSIENDDGTLTPSGWSTRTENGGTGKPFSFIPGKNLIPGWTEGVLTMREGERAIMHVPPSKGYGASAQGSKGATWFVPANSKLHFDIEILGQHGGTIVPSSTVATCTSKTPTCSYDIHIFYYGWYGTPTIDHKWLHWNHPRLPHWNAAVARRYSRARHVPEENDIGSSFFPKLGMYSSHDPAVLEDHMVQIRRCGAGVVVVSWYPPGMADNEGREADSLIPLLLEKAGAEGLKIAFHIEPYKDRSPNTVRRDLEYILKKYGQNQAFYREEKSGLPILYVYDSYLSKDSAWEALLKKGGSISIRGTDLDAIMIGLMVEYNHRASIAIAGWDGFYTYFAANEMSYGSTWANFKSMASFARANGLTYIPSVGPGYIDVEVRPWNGKTTRDRRNGDYYREALGNAVRNTARFISITSFNEWHEGTNIEAAVVGPKRKFGKKYLDYGAEKGSETLYLDITREKLLPESDFGINQHPAKK